MNISFTEFKPALALAPYIETYWFGNFNLNRNVNFTQSVMPNGCIELIIHLSDHHCALHKNGNPYMKSPPFTLLGLFPSTYTVKFHENVKVFGIRFFPDGFHNLFGIPPAEFLSTYEDGVDVIGKDLMDFCLYIREAFRENDQLTLANRFFMKLLGKNHKDFDYTHLAMKFIRQRKGLIGFADITDKIPISLRQLQRGFKNHYGLTITDYIRLSRLNAINQYMLNNPANLTELAYSMRFADQSHFIKEFKHYSGLAPKGFIKQKNDFIVNAG